MMRLSIALKTTSILLLLGWAHLIFAFVAIPPIDRVIDQTNTLTEQQKSALSGILKRYEASKGSQIAILMVETTEPETIEQYSLRVAEKWKLGRKKVDDGVLLIVAMKDRTMRIEVGYGLEGALNDAMCKRIISEVITPSFKNRQYYEGLNNGIIQIIKTLEGEPLPPAVKNNSPDIYNTFIFVIFASTMLAGFVKPYFSQTEKRKLHASAFISFIAGVTMFILSLSWYLTLGMLFASFALSWFALSSSGTIGGGFGGGGNGRSGGGGFSGGGGGFGGGGSSGRW